MKANTVFNCATEYGKKCGIEFVKKKQNCVKLTHKGS